MFGSNTRNILILGPSLDHVPWQLKTVCIWLLGEVTTSDGMAVQNSALLRISDTQRDKCATCNRDLSAILTSLPMTQLDIVRLLNMLLNHSFWRPQTFSYPLDAPSST